MSCRIQFQQRSYHRVRSSLRNGICTAFVLERSQRTNIRHIAHDARESQSSYDPHNRHMTLTVMRAEAFSLAHALEQTSVRTERFDPCLRRREIVPAVLR